MENFDPITPMFANLVPIITQNYGKVLIVLGALIGISFVIYLVKAHVGGTGVSQKGFRKTVYIDGVSQQKNGYISVDY